MMCATHNECLDLFSFRWQVEQLSSHPELFAPKGQIVTLTNLKFKRATLACFNIEYNF